MALDGNRLGIAIATAIAAGAPSDDGEVSQSELEDIWKLVGIEIIKEFTDNAVTDTTVIGGSSAGNHAGVIT